MSLAEAIPYIGPLFADAQFRWWFLGLLVSVGPVPEDVTIKTTKKTESGETVETVTVTKWRMGGLLRVLMTAAASHARLADRLGSLETAFEQFGKDFNEKLGAFTTELRTLREQRVLVPAAAVVANQHVVAPVGANGIAAVSAACCDAPIPSARQSFSSRP